MQVPDLRHPPASRWPSAAMPGHPASLSSTGWWPRARTDATISSLLALPLPVACFLIVPTAHAPGTGSGGARTTPVTWPGIRRRRKATSVETWQASHSKCRQSMPSQDCFDLGQPAPEAQSASAAFKAMRAEALRTAHCVAIAAAQPQPVVVPDRGGDRSWSWCQSLFGRVPMTLTECRNLPWRALARAIIGELHANCREASVNVVMGISCRREGWAGVGGSLGPMPETRAHPALLRHFSSPRVIRDREKAPLRPTELTGTVGPLFPVVEEFGGQRRRWPRAPSAHQASDQTRPRPRKYSSVASTARLGRIKSSVALPSPGSPEPPPGCPRPLGQQFLLQMLVAALGRTVIVNRIRCSRHFIASSMLQMAGQWILPATNNELRKNSKVTGAWKRAEILSPPRSVRGRPRFAATSSLLGFGGRHEAPRSQPCRSGCRSVTRCSKVSWAHWWRSRQDGGQRIRTYRLAVRACRTGRTEPCSCVEPVSA